MAPAILLPGNGDELTRYDYRCPACGVFEIRASMGSAAASRPCPTCGEPGQRLFSAPLLNRTPQALASLRYREEKSADQPDVVRRPAGHSGNSRPQPALRRLPRQ